jgi:hypothetical protein
MMRGSSLNSMSITDAILPFFFVVSSLGLTITFTAKHFMYPEQRDMSFREALDLIKPEHVAFGSGAASLVSHLALALADEGDAVLIPAPVSCIELKTLHFCLTFVNS